MPGKVCVSWGGRRVRRQAATRIIVAVLVPHLLGLLLLRLLLRGHRAAERGEHASTRREPGSEGEGERGPDPRSDGGGKLGGASCMTRGRGRRPRPVARSQAREDHTTTPRWRARARIVLSRRGRPVSGFGQKKGNSTTCEPSTLQRSAWSHPTCGLRSACTSSPRWARTARWKGAG